MKIFLTYDYELFFGEQSGTVRKCMLEPTEDLFSIAKGKDVFLTFFVDVGYLISAEKYPMLADELKLVKNQIQRMVTLGHEVQLHIHPHWENAVYENGKWQMNADNGYKLVDFNSEIRSSIIKKYKTYLDTIIGKKTRAFRAGGWCIQPFNELKTDFKANGIQIDSSVIPGDFMQTDNYAIDFRNAPLKSKYHVCVEDENGSFTEYPISSLRYSPLFFWKLYVLGRLIPRQHKMIGDGEFVSQGGRKKRVLTTYTHNHVSSDGYFAQKLDAGLKKAMNLGHKEMVVIGHPKGNTSYSLKKLKNFVDQNHKKHLFTTFDRELCK